eukprot:351140-Chlamydomonas_euryale.AAC.39
MPLLSADFGANHTCWQLKFIDGQAKHARHVSAIRLETHACISVSANRLDQTASTRTYATSTFAKCKEEGKGH